MCGVNCNWIRLVFGIRLFFLYFFFVLVIILFNDIYWGILVWYILCLWLLVVVIFFIIFWSFWKKLWNVCGFFVFKCCKLLIILVFLREISFSFFLIIGFEGVDVLLVNVL